MRKIFMYDTTLRDGTQGEGVSFSAADKLKVLHLLDDLGIDYIEGGYPGSNPKDVAFFQGARKERLKHAKLVGFGMTHKIGVKPQSDPLLKALLRSGVDRFAIVGKTWPLHVKEVLKTSLQANLDCIHNTLRYLSKYSEELIFDAEHFFDAYKSNPDYAVAVLRAAAEGGANWLVLCDTNGGSLPGEVAAGVRSVSREFSVPIGIHTHNDGELAVSNALAAVEAGATQVHGTINGFGERCGNANLCSILPNLELKVGRTTIGKDNLRTLRDVSRTVYELANVVPPRNQAFVGEAAFAHKGGMHVSGIEKDTRTYEHIAPELIGNRRRVLVSDLSGRSNILSKAREFGIRVDMESPGVKRVLRSLKDLEHEGYQFEGAEGSFELLMQRALRRNGGAFKYFKLVGFRVIDEKRSESEPPFAEATIMIEVDGVREHTAAVGNGPVNALDSALRKALEKFYPAIREVELRDYKVRVISGTSGTQAQVRVLIESGDKHESWGTVGVSHNIIEASWQALVDGLAYKLYKDSRRKKR